MVDSKNCHAKSITFNHEEKEIRVDKFKLSLESELIQDIGPFEVVLLIGFIVDCLVAVATGRVCNSFKGVRY